MSEPTQTAVIVHTQDCPGARIVRRETPHRHLIICTACQAQVSVPRRNEWRDTPNERNDA